MKKMTVGMLKEILEDIPNDTIVWSADEGGAYELEEDDYLYWKEDNGEYLFHIGG